MADVEIDSCKDNTTAKSQVNSFNTIRQLAKFMQIKNRLVNVILAIMLISM